MLPAKRRDLLLAQLEENGYLEIAKACQDLGVSRATIRRDLSDLEREGLLTIVHGGAIPRSGSTSFEPSLQFKRAQYAAEKRRIGSAAAALVRNGQSVILDAGSTTYEVALQLKGRHNLTIITNDIHILSAFTNASGINAVCTGGLLRGSVHTLVGDQTVGFLRNLHVDWTFLGADAVDLRHGITNVNLVEVAAKQAMIAAGHHVVLVADSSKFGRISLAKVCDLTEISMIITDDRLPSDIREQLAEMSIEVKMV